MFTVLVLTYEDHLSTHSYQVPLPVNSRNVANSRWGSGGLSAWVNGGGGKHARAETPEM